MKLVSEYLWMPFLLSVLWPRSVSVACIIGQPPLFIQQFINSSIDAIWSHHRLEVHYFLIDGNISNKFECIQKVSVGDICF
jgi:hypothetical protein